ncbi:MAG: DMT family transporter [Thiohalomonadales bacterium]
MLALYKRIEANNSLYGLLCVLLATLGLSLKAVLIKLIYQTDPTIDAISVLAIRFLLALPFFIFLLYFPRRKFISIGYKAETIIPLLLLGSIGFYLSAILDFSALAYIPAGLERLILFLYPTFVVMISLFIRPQEVSRRTILALLISYAGIVVVFIEQAPHLDADMIKGALMVVAAALVFAIYTVMSVKQIHRHGSIGFTAYAMIAATLTTFIHAITIHGPGVFVQSQQVYLLTLIMAIFSTVLPLLLMAEGIKRIGAPSSAIISTSGPPLTLALAFFLLGETFGILQAIGGSMILVGVFMVSRKR